MWGSYLVLGACDPEKRESTTLPSQRMPPSFVIVPSFRPVINVSVNLVSRPGAICSSWVQFECSIQVFLSQPLRHYFHRSFSAIEERLIPLTLRSSCFHDHDVASPPALQLNRVLLLVFPSLW